jgi:hypothetical protein
MNKVVVMGRKTLDSLPNGNPLKNRINLIITSNKSYENTGSIIYGNVDEINEEIKKYDTNYVFIIGGESIYKLFLDRCDTVYVTRVDSLYKSDKHMPNLAFEGFIFDDVINNGISINNEPWNIEKWITSECKPYKSVLWLVDENNKVLFLYSYDLTTWRDIYSDDLFEPTTEFKQYLIDNIIENEDKEFLNKVIQDHYRMDIMIPNKKIRFAAFGSTKQEARQNIGEALISLLI